MKGRPRALWVLDYGLFRVLDGPRDIGLCGFLIATDADEYILMDTGLPAKYIDDPVGAGAEDGLDTFGHVLAIGPENRFDRQLALAGITPGDVTLMIQSHTHIDHIGGLGECQQAPMVISAAERALPRPLYWSGGQPLDWPDRAYLEIDSDVQLGPDLTVHHVPGHAPGQLALGLRLPETGRVLLTSDAISRPSEPAEGFPGAWDAKAAAMSATRLLREAADALVIHGHCPAQWPSLRKAPQTFT